MIQRKGKYMAHKILLALALLLVVGCQREVIDGMDDNRRNADGSIGFRFKTEDAELETDEFQTKGTPQSTMQGYDSVSVNVYSHTSNYDAIEGNDVQFLRRVKLDQEATNWKYTPSMFWPVGQKLSFIAYTSDIPFKDAGISFLPETGTPKQIVYEVPTEVIKQPDLLVATKFNQDKIDNISFTMNHALACVSFCGIAPEAGTYVKSITLRNVCGKGTVTLDDPDITWQVDEDSRGLEVFEAGVLDNQELGKDPLINNNYLMTAEGYLMMIPQKLENAAIDVLYWNGSDDKDNKVITYTLPTNDPSYESWRPGKNYIYKFGSQSKEDITVVYYEKYAGDKYGLYYYDQATLKNSILEDQEIFEAGYGVLTKEAINGSVAGICLKSPTDTKIMSGSVVELKDISSFLYPVNQSGAEGTTFVLPVSSTPVDVYFNGSNKPCGTIIPHFAKGVYRVKTAIIAHAIRTPQQMRNITSMVASQLRNDQTYTQELNLDFAKTAIGGGVLSTAVVNRNFNDLFKGQNKRIENLNINAPLFNGGLFLGNSGEIREVILLNSSILATGNTGGIAAINQKEGVIELSRVIGENSTDKQVVITGMSGYTGAVTGCNYGRITGNTAEEQATELPIAEVMGWVSINGANSGTGGIAGENQGTIATCLVNGVYVTGNTVQIAQITIKGGEYVGGIVGGNRAKIDGNFSTVNGKAQPQPDVAGLVSIAGTNFVGGIAGINTSSNAVLNQVNLRLGRGDANNAITISGELSVGGIVGYNEDGGTLQADGGSFISVRGNVYISGVKNVGGIVGNNQSGNISNCFVYNFYSQTYPLKHYAPKISGTTYVGGIVGYAGNNANITNCSVFSTVSALNAEPGEDATNSRVEITATEDAVGGIAGRGFVGLNLNANYVLGNVKIDGKTKFCGGIMGENASGTRITSVHVGNSGSEVSGIYTNLFDAVSLPVRDIRMKTGGLVMTKTSGTPTITGNLYVGGICGVNWGTIDGVSIMDNVKIGTPASTFVGGITGGNGLDAIVSNCKTYNPATGDAAVIIEGYMQIGGIIGLNNGIVDQCQLGLSGLNQSRLITITGTSKLGGIAGSNGGEFGNEPTGNANTRITNSNVHGKVLIQATDLWAYVGGIIGENLPTSKIIDCNVIGYASSYTSADVFSYDVTLIGNNMVGGIAGANYGHIYGKLPSYNRVTNTAIIAEEYAGGLVGKLESNKANAYEALLYNCDVSYGVLVHKWGNAVGAFAGDLMGVDDRTVEDGKQPTLFGTSPGGAKNRIYTGVNNPVRIDKNDSRVKFPPPDMNDLPYPPDPPKNGNLWAKYQMMNYLYWIEYTN